jgi:hypothetical protein
MMARTKSDATLTLKTADVQEVPYFLGGWHVAQCVRPAPRLPKTNPWQIIEILREALGGMKDKKILRIEMGARGGDFGRESFGAASESAGSLLLVIGGCFTLIGCSKHRMVILRMLH